MSGKRGLAPGEAAHRTLPKSGLAEEVLAALGGGAPTPKGPDQLYRFADSVQRASAAREEHRPEEALETWVTFSLDGESFGLPVSHVQEILRVSGITRVPHAPRVVRGVTNMRGKVLPVVDLRVRLGLGPAPLAEPSRILVVGSKGRLMGLLVDAVQQVLRIDRHRFQPPPPDVMTSQSDYFLAVYHLEEALVILLDVERVLALRADAPSEPLAVGASR